MPQDRISFLQTAIARYEQRLQELGSALAEFQREIRDVKQERNLLFKQILKRAETEQIQKIKKALE